MNAFQKERVPERVPESEERSRNAFLIFKKERDRNAIVKITRNAKETHAFLKRSFFKGFCSKTEKFLRKISNRMFQLCSNGVGIYKKYEMINEKIV